jgi:hypothetical protein
MSGPTFALATHHQGVTAYRPCDALALGYLIIRRSVGWLFGRHRTASDFRCYSATLSAGLSTLVTPHVTMRSCR